MYMEDFKERVREELAALGYKVRFQSVTKNNGMKLEGVSFVSTESNIMPTLYLEYYKALYENGMEMEGVIERIISDNKNHQFGGRLDMEWYRDWEQVRDKVRFKLISRDFNMELLKDIPHIEMLDLCKAYYVVIENEMFGLGTISIHNHHMDMWGITLEELDAIAKRNTETKMQAVIMDMETMLEQLGEEFDIGDMAGDIPTLYVATNKEKFYGAAVLCYDGVLEEFAENIQNDFYILPSSLHECIFVPEEKGSGIGGLRDMVREVNRNMVEETQVLSDSVYVYRRENGKIKIA